MEFPRLKSAGLRGAKAVADAEMTVTPRGNNMAKKMLTAAIDPAELTLRIAEACIAMRRPPNLSAKDALAQLRAREPDIIAGFDRAAVRVCDYFVECINESGNWAEMS
jgi:hypothetical protein